MNIRRVSTMAAVILWGLSVCAVSPSVADEGDQGDATASFLKIDPSARMTAMGSAYTASPDGAYTAYHNPAGLSTIDRTSASLTHLDIFEGITYQGLSAVGSWGESSGWSLSYQGIDFGDQQRTQVGGGGSADPVTGLGEFGADDLVLNLSTGKTIIKGWSIGGTAKYVKKQIAEYDDSTLSADLGTQYQITPTVRVGARVRNVFGELALDQEGDPLPRSVDAGISWSKQYGIHSLRVNAYDAMDLFAFSSTSETQGMVLTEAMASGCPVVALEATGVNDVLQSGRNGYAVSNPSTDVFCERMKEYLAKPPAQRRNFREAARSTAKKFSMSCTAERLETTYERTVRCHDKRTGQGSRWLRTVGRLGKVEWKLFRKRLGAVKNSIESGRAGVKLRYMMRNAV